MSNELENLLGKFDSVEVDNTLPISESDLAFCERMQKLYEEKVADLKVWLERLRGLEEQHPSPDFMEIKEYGRVDEAWQKKIDAMQKNPFAPFQFSNLYGITWVQNQLVIIKHTFIEKIKNYFNGEYNLKTEFDRDFIEQRKIEKLHYRHVVDDIVSQCGGLDFEEMGIERLKESFRSEVRYQSNVSFIKDKIKFTNFFYFYSSWGGIKWEYNNSRLPKLRQALSLFETGKFDDICYELQRVVGDEVNFKKPYELHNFSKVKSVRVYKNGRLDIKFETGTNPKDFYDFMGIDKLPQSR